MTERLEIYVDTNVLMDWVSPERANPNSQYILERLRTDPDLIGVVSTFGLMEAVQNHQDGTFQRSMVSRAYTLNEFQAAARDRDLSVAECSRCYDDVYNVVVSLGKKATLRSIDSGEMWAEAVRLLRETNISAPDAIHAGVATASQCDVLATSDTHLFNQLSRQVHDANRPAPLLTNKSVPGGRFRVDFDRLIARLRARRAGRPRKKVPQELRKIVGAVGLLVGPESDPKKFKESYERKLRRMSKSSTPKSK